jgi:hypothetical protein
MHYKKKARSFLACGIAFVLIGFGTFIYFIVLAMKFGTDMTPFQLLIIAIPSILIAIGCFVGAVINGGKAVLNQ